MSRPLRSFRGPLAAIALLILAIVVALPVLAASPSPSTGAPNSHEPKASKAPKAEESPEVQVTLRGPVSATTAADGSTTYSIAANGKTTRLEAGPPWFFGANYPLKPFVGKTVTIVGEQEGDSVDVVSVDGVALRAPGKPPWAGGWKVVGSAHPGWSQDKADRAQAHLNKQKEKAAARAACAAAGTCKADEPDGSEAPEGSPEGSEAPGD